MRILPVVNTLHLITVVDAEGNSRSIEADGHAEDYISSSACKLRLFGSEVIYRDPHGKVVKAIPAVSDEDKLVWIGSPASDEYTPPPAARWFRSATITVVSLDAHGVEIERTVPRTIPAVRSEASEA